MNRSSIKGEKLHALPKDVRGILLAKSGVKDVWDDITPLARNEWICWIISAKQSETRNRRLRIMSENLLAGKRRPCCWAGCTHR